MRCLEGVLEDMTEKLSDSDTRAGEGAGTGGGGMTRGTTLLLMAIKRVVGASGESERGGVRISLSSFPCDVF